MKPRTTTVLAIVVLVCMGFIFFLQTAATLFPSGEPVSYLKSGDVRGVALNFKGEPWTLNFHQQKEFIQLFNRAVPVGKEGLQLQKVDGLDSVVIYFFNAPDATLPIVGIYGYNLYFNAPMYNPNGYLRDVSIGELLDVLEGAHDP